MQAETAAVVPQDAIQAASGAAKSQAGIPYIGPILAVAAMGAMMAAVMGLMGGGAEARQPHQPACLLPLAAGIFPLASTRLRSCMKTRWYYRQNMPILFGKWRGRVGVGQQMLHLMLPQWIQKMLNAS